MRIMTFNIRGSTYDDGVNVWPNRAPLNVRVIKENSPDIIGFQEYQDGNHRVYTEQLSHYHFEMGLVYNRPGRQFYNTIAWRKSRFKLIPELSQTIYLSDTPETYSKSWGAARVHVFHWVTLEDLESKRQISIGNTHLDHESEPARLQSAKLIAETLNSVDISEHHVILGDFNSPADLIPAPPQTESVHGIFMSNNLIDTFTPDSIHPVPHTVHGFQAERFHSRRYSVPLRLDWILTSPSFDSRDFQIIKTSEPPLFPSDHFPVSVELKPVSL